MLEMRTKVAAFTIVELIAVMLLSGLIFSMALLVIQIMQQQNSHQEMEHQEVLKIEQLSSLLQKDAYQATSILVEGKQVFFDYKTHSITYQFNEQDVWRSIIETSIHTDTFALPTLLLEATWEDQPIEVGLLNKLKWQSHFFEQLFELNIQKKYDHKTLFDLNQYVHTTPF